MHGHLNVKDMRSLKGTETEEHSIKFIQIKFPCYVAVSQKILYFHKAQTVNAIMKK